MEILKSLGIDFRVLIIQAGLFIVFYFIVRHFLFGKILTDISDREKEWQKLNDELQNKTRLLANLSSDLAAKKEKFDQEVLTEIQGMVKEALNNRNVILANARKEAEEMLKNAREEINMEKEKIIKELSPQIRGIVELMKKKVTGIM